MLIPPVPVGIITVLSVPRLAYVIVAWEIVWEWANTDYKDILLISADAGGPLELGDIEVCYCVCVCLCVDPSPVPSWSRTPTAGCVWSAPGTSTPSPWTRGRVSTLPSTLATPGRSNTTAPRESNRFAAVPETSSRFVSFPVQGAGSDPTPMHTSHQRVHGVKVEGDRVLVKLSELSRTLDSDRYYTEEYRELTESVLREPVLRQRQQLPWGRGGAAIHSSRSGLKPFSKPKW